MGRALVYRAVLRLLQPIFRPLADVIIRGTSRH